MTDFADIYQSKLTTKEDLVSRFEPNDVVFLGVWYGEPYGTIAAINEGCKEAQDLSIASGIATAPSAYMHYPGVLTWTAFLGPQERGAIAATDNIFYTPLNFTDGQRYAEYGRKIDYYVHRVAPMNERGMFNFSMTAGWEYTVLQWLKTHSPNTTIVFEVNKNLPVVYGLEEFGNNELSIDIPDVIVEDDAPPLDYPVPPANDIELQIARNVADLVQDKATVQLGFGTLPMAIGHLLQEKKDLGIHTEMFCEAHIDLVEAGSVTNAHKGIYDGINVATFALGTPRMHEWMRENKDVAMLPVEKVNRVDILAQVNNLTSVNSILSVDMSGQTCAHCIGPRTYSGLGGAFEFAYGSQLSPGGIGMACLPSTTTLKDGTVISNITAQHPAGARITTPEHTTDWIVTEHGAARLGPLAIEERAAALIEIAHPDFREALAKEVRDNGIDLEKIKKAPPLPEGILRTVG